MKQQCKEHLYKILVISHHTAQHRLVPCGLLGKRHLSKRHQQSEQTDQESCLCH